MAHALLDHTVDLLRELVAFETVSTSSNVACAEWLADRLDGCGCDVELFRDHAYGDDKASLVAWLGPARDGGLILSGHMDVVPWADQPGWTRDALRLGRVGDLMVGRGVADMKAFLAQCVAIVEALDSERLTHPVMLVFTCDEEVGCFGAERLLPELERLQSRRPLPPDCVIGEPTSFRVYRAHKGHVHLRLETLGRGGHSSRPDLGANAIAAAAAAATAVGALAHELTTRVSDSDRLLFPDFPAVPFNLGTIRGGTADNMIAEACELVIGFRPGPTTDVDALLAELTSRVTEAVSRAAPGARVAFDDPELTPAMCSPADAPTCRELCALVGETDPSGAPFATDGGQFERIGIRSWICGPGELAQAHQPNESLSIAAVDRGLELVESLVNRRCRPA